MLSSRRMLAGLMSRWISPWLCAAASPSAICCEIRITSGMEIGPSRIRSFRDRPSTHSITRYGTSLNCPTAWMVTTLGWLIPAADRASRKNRCRAVSLEMSAGAMSFMATIRSRAVSKLRTTIPIAPCPISERTS